AQELEPARRLDVGRALVEDAIELGAPQAGEVVAGEASGASRDRRRAVPGGHVPEWVRAADRSVERQVEVAPRQAASRVVEQVVRRPRLQPYLDADLRQLLPDRGGPPS